MEESNNMNNQGSSYNQNNPNGQYDPNNQYNSNEPFNQAGPNPGVYYDPLVEAEGGEEPKKKKGKGVIVVILIILLILVLMCMCGCALVGVFYAFWAQPTSNNGPSPSPIYTAPVEEKPIIYLYPENEQEIQVLLSNPERLLVDYPDYHQISGWCVSGFPDGTLMDMTTPQTYYGLYYESIRVTQPASWCDAKDGFVVKSEDSAAFLEEKLATLGLSEREAEEMIIYWLPTLEQGYAHFIRFEEKDVIEENMGLEISPEPDTMIRIMMTVEELSEEEAKDAVESVPEQQLEEVTREGFTVVEWGGTRVTKNE